MKHALVTYGPFVAIMLLALALDKRGMLSFLAPAAAPAPSPKGP